MKTRETQGMGTVVRPAGPNGEAPRWKLGSLTPAALVAPQGRSLFSVLRSPWRQRRHKGLA